MIIKTNVPKNNPELDVFTVTDMKMFIKAYRSFLETAEGVDLFNSFLPVVYDHCLKSLWGPQWTYGMSLLMAHYFTITSKDMGGEMGEAQTMGQVAALGEPTGILTGQSVGEISINYDLTRTSFDITQEPDAAFFNESKFGMRYYALWRGKNPFVIGVVI